MTRGTFATAYAIDWLLGDPRWFPHPVRLMGSTIAFGDRHLNRPDGALAHGALLTAAVAAGSFMAGRFAVARGGRIVEVGLAWTVLATRSLLSESAAVLDALAAGDIEVARARVAMIVGRDTAMLDEHDIVRAVIETLAEGLCDGVVAPLVYLAAGGVPLAMAFKAVSTMDSMIGHMEEPYTLFGRVAARLDDLANFVPARIAAAGICAVAGADAASAWRVLLHDGGKHPSPNAGRPEAAMAGALGVELGGMNYYAGQPSPKPVLGAGGRRPTIADGRRALRITAAASVAVFAVAWIGLRLWGRDR